MVAMLWEKSDVEDPNLIFLAVNVEPSDGFPIQKDDLKFSPRESLLVELVLGRELHHEEGFLLGSIPAQRRKFILSRAGIDAVEKISVFCRDRTERHHSIHLPELSARVS